MEYKDFINEIEPLLVVMDEQFYAIDYDKNFIFRKCRFQITELLNRIKKEGYDIICDIENRTFGSVFQIEKYKEKHFNMELQDTINEVEIIIRNYRNYGTPEKSNKTSRTTKDLEFPNKVTLKWIYNNTSYRLWGLLATILLAAFMFGISVGQSVLFKDIKDKFTQSYSDKTDTIVPKNKK